MAAKISTTAIKPQPSYIDAGLQKHPLGLSEAPTFYPSEEEFTNAYSYIKSIASDGEKYGLLKIVPPANWNPKFSLDTGVSMNKTLMSI